jgi:hypothetical protein
VIKAILLFFTVWFLGGFSQCYAQRKPTPDQITETTLSIFYSRLESFQKLCGRFPTTKESLSALRERANGFNCPTGWNEETNLGGDEIVGWKLPLQYSSDGTQYKLLASQGYFVTDKSPARSNASTQHWENPDKGAWPLRLNGFPSWEYFFVVVTLLSIGTCSILFRLFLWIFPTKNSWKTNTAILKGSMAIGLMSLVAGALAYLLMPNL